MLTFAEKYLSVDMRDTNLLPTPKHKGPDFDERLREAMDVDEMMAESAQELKEYANKRIPLPPRDLSKKDNDLLKKVSLLAQAVLIEEPPIIGHDVSLLILWFRSTSNGWSRRLSDASCLKKSASSSTRSTNCCCLTTKTRRRSTCSFGRITSKYRLPPSGILLTTLRTLSQTQRLSK